MRILSRIQIWRGLLSPHQGHATSQQILNSAIGTGLFIGLFLVLFRPFGMAEGLAGYQWLMVASFGPLNTLLVLANELGIQRLLQRLGALNGQSKTGNVIWYWWTPLFIAFGNFFYYQALCGSFDLGFYTFVQFSGRILLVGLLLVTLGTMYSRIKHLRQRYNPLQNSSVKFGSWRPEATTELIRIQSENGNQVLEVDLDCLLFMRSQDNYVSIVQHKGGKPQLQLLRQSLKAVASQLKQAPVVRCHRSFIVNLRQAETLQGNAQGMRIRLKGHPEAIPVSRKYIATVKAGLRRLERD